MSDAQGPDADDTDAGDALERLERLLTRVRGDVDEVIVQLNLANKDIRDELSRRLAAVQDAELAARSRLADAGRDLVSGLGAQRDGLVQALKDVRLAFESAREAAERHRPGSDQA